MSAMVLIMYVQLCLFTCVYELKIYHMYMYMYMCVCGGGGGGMITQSGWKHCPHSWGSWTLGVYYSVYHVSGRL